MNSRKPASIILVLLATMFLAFSCEDTMMLRNAEVITEAVDGDQPSLLIKDFVVTKISAPSGGNTQWYYLAIVKDKTTGREYVLISSVDGLSLTPRLPAEEEEEESYY